VGKRESAILEAIQSLATQNPGACAELVTKMFDKLAEADRNAYRYLMNRVISQELGAAPEGCVGAGKATAFGGARGSG